GFRWVVGTTEARPCRPLVEHDEVPLRERLALRRGEAIPRRVALAERRDQEMAARPEHAVQLAQPRMLEILREMSHDGEGVNEIEAGVTVRKRRRESVHRHLGEREILVAPRDHLWIDVAPTNARAGQFGP